MARISFKVIVDDDKLNIEIRNEKNKMSVYETVYYLDGALREVVRFIDNNKDFEIDGNVKESPLAALNEYANDVIHRFCYFADYENVVKKMIIMNDIITCHVKNAIKKQESLFDIMYHWFKTRPTEVVYIEGLSYHSSCELSSRSFLMR